MWSDTGAYASVGLAVIERAVSHSAAAYTVPNVHVTGTAVITNNAPCGAMRGFGVNQSNFAFESCLDELCKLGGFDRWQFRWDNALTEGKTTATGQVLDRRASASAAAWRRSRTASAPPSTPASPPA